MEWAGAWVLLVNVPLGGVAAIATSACSSGSRASRPAPDLRGALLPALGLGAPSVLVRRAGLGLVTVGSFWPASDAVGFAQLGRTPGRWSSHCVAGGGQPAHCAAGCATSAALLAALKAGFTRSPTAVVMAAQSGVRQSPGRVAGRHGHRVIVLVSWSGPRQPGVCSDQFRRVAVEQCAGRVAKGGLCHLVARSCALAFRMPGAHGVACDDLIGKPGLLPSCGADGLPSVSSR